MSFSHPKRILTSLTILALVPGSAVLVGAAPAAAAPLPAPYSASAHGDLVNLTTTAAGSSLVGLKVAHSRATVDSDSDLVDNSVAESKNVEAAVAGFPIPIDTASATAPPSEDPAARVLLPVPLSPVATVGAITGDVVANYTDADSCVPAVDGRRLLSAARTDLANLQLLSVPGVGTVADVGASWISAETELVDQPVGGAHMVSTTTTEVADIALLGGQVAVTVSDPVVVRATSDGTVGTAGFVTPPTIVATVAGTDNPIPLNGTPQTIELPPALELLADLTITAFTPTQQSTGAVGEADLQNLLRIELDVVSLLGEPLVGLDLGVAPLHVRALAPTGGVECDADTSTFVTIDSPDGTGTLTDSSVTFSGTREPGATVVVTDASGDVICTAIAAPDGTWTCTGTVEEGTQLYTATATDAAENTATDTVQLTVDSVVTGGITITAPAEGSTTTDTTPTVSGTTEPGATVTVTEGETEICTTVADSEGAWTCDSATLPLGAHTFTAVAEDTAGNTATDEVSFTVIASDPGDTTPPVAPVIIAPAEGSTTTDTTPTVTGTGEPGAAIKVTEGGTTICTATVAADGTWSCTPTTALPLGQHTITATATDAAGNTSPADTATFTIVATPNPDRDGDGLPNTDETKAGTNPDDPDTDKDGLTDGQEVDHDGTGPDTGIGTDPLKADTDGDGLQDGQEVNTTRTDPLDADTDDDGLTDGVEVNGMTIKERFELCGKKVANKIRVTTNPLVKDTDKDGLTDGLEVKGYTIKQVVFVTRSGETLTIGKTRSNPTKADTDKDGLTDKVEKTGSANKKWQRHKSDPTKCDTDQGGVSDGREIKLGSDPSQIKSGPNDLESRVPAGS